MSEYRNAMIRKTGAEVIAEAAITETVRFISCDEFDELGWCNHADHMESARF